MKKNPGPFKIKKDLFSKQIAFTRRMDRIFEASE